MRAGLVIAVFYAGLSLGPQGTVGSVRDGGRILPLSGTAAATTVPARTPRVPTLEVVLPNVAVFAPRLVAIAAPSLAVRSAPPGRSATPVLAARAPPPPAV